MKGVNTSKPNATQYITGTNDRLDRVIAMFPDDKPLWMVQGKYGRMPITADTAEEACDTYTERGKNDEFLLLRGA